MTATITDIHGGPSTRSINVNFTQGPDNLPPVSDIESFEKKQDFFEKED